MISELKLVNFRNFWNKIIKNFDKNTFIVWKNGIWKTNLLEAISLIWNNSITKLALEKLVKVWEDYFFVELKYNWEKLWFYYSKKDKKRNYLVDNKKTTKKEFLKKTYNCVVFSSMFMNMMYLWPSLRRDFLDDGLKTSFFEYENLLKDYKKILKSRNSFLKAINEWKAKEEDIKFWDEKFVEKAVEIYNFRFKFVNFLEKTIFKSKKYFFDKIQSLTFEYITKVDRKNIKKSIEYYLEKNLKRDIIIWKTAIWPHIDDFEIRLDDINLSLFASRWEIKSVLIYLKFLEWLFIEKNKWEKAIFIVDDLFSELDENHRNMILESISYYQSFISDINFLENNFSIKL